MSSPRELIGSLSGRVVRLGVAAIRHSHLLPKSFPDGLGDDKALADVSLDAEIVVYFADTVVGLYQLRSWYPALRALHHQHPVVVLGIDSRATAAIRAESGLPAYTITHYSTIDSLLRRGDIAVALYVNHNASNFSMLRFPSLVHVSIMHGDSDKVVSISNQTKAYDFTFVAGQAAIDRLSAYLPRYDAESRCVIVGRPQARALPARKTPPDGARRTVLYAPTWEGGTPSAAYSSVAAYGPRIVRALTEDGRFRVVYRPHPLTGTRIPEFGDADRRLRSQVADAAAADPSAGHTVSVGGDIAKDLASADLLVSDVSSVAIDFLVADRPLLITVPPDPGVLTAVTPLLTATPRLGPSDLTCLADLVWAQIDTDPAKAEREAVTAYYLGDTAPGASIDLFIRACGRMIELARADNAVTAERMEAAGGETA
jgi:hypothetical protein